MRPTHIALVIAAALAIAPATVHAQGVGLEVGTELPDFTLTDLEGAEIEIREVVQPGKPAVIEIWAEWCTICRALEPQMRAIDEAHGDDVSIVAIAVAINQTREKVQAHKDRFRLPWPFLWDGEGIGVRALDAGSTGIILLVDREGKIAYTGTGARQDLVGEIEKLLGER